MRYCLFIGTILIVVAKIAHSQAPDFSKVPNLHKGDSTSITYLINNGIKVDSGKVICWFPEDSLSMEEMQAITGMINKGIQATEKFIGAPLPWQSHINETYTFYFRFDRFVSHASCAGFVSVPFWRIKSGKAPWLHEALHEMLYTNTGTWFDRSITDEEADKEMPLWLFEGLPDYIAITVSKKENLPWFDVFSNSSRNNIDSLFKEDLKSERAAYILSFIGKKGVIPELSSEKRMLYAPCFYHGSCSFVQYLAERYSITILLDAVSSFRKEQEKIEASTGKSIDDLKKEWLHSLEIE